MLPVMTIIRWLFVLCGMGTDPVKTVYSGANSSGTRADLFSLGSGRLQGVRDGGLSSKNFSGPNTVRPRPSGRVPRK